MADSGSALATATTSSTDEVDNSKLEIQQITDAEEEAVTGVPQTPQRDKWATKAAYILTLVGYAVGFGNIWRFPYVMRENGGLAFLIPYCIMLGLVGIPIFFLELAVGQRRRKGVVYAWAEISPNLGGIGISCGWLCFLVGLYYNTLIAYCLHYFVTSFFNPLPWTSCRQVGVHLKNNSYAEECRDKVGGVATKYYWFRGTLDISPGIDHAGDYSWSLALGLLVSWAVIYGVLIKGTESVGMVVYVTAIYPYFVLIIFFIANLCIEPGKAWLGAYRLLQPKWDLLYQPLTWLKAGSQIFFSLGLGFGCLVVFASYNPARNNVYNDAISISLINCGTSLFAALVVFPMIGNLGHHKYDDCVDQMSKLFLKSSIKEKAEEGKYDIYFFVDEKAKTLRDLGKYMLTIKYGYGEAAGEDKMKYFSSLVTVEDTEVLGGSGSVDDFLVPGMAGQDISVLRDCSIGMEATASGGGTGFVFQAFTQAVLAMPGSNFWSALFFTMLVFLGIDSGFGTVEGVVAAFEDWSHLKRLKSTSITCGVMFVLAILIFPFGWGPYVLDLMDQWSANWTLLAIALLECIAVAWDYGLAKMSYDILLMTGSKPNLYIILCWRFISPIVILLMLLGSIGQFLYSNIKSEGVKYDVFDPSHPAHVKGDVTLTMPAFEITIGFLLMVFIVLWIPLHFFLYRTRYSFLKYQAPADFPEAELREERHINVTLEEDQFTDAEKKIMGRTSLHNLQLHRDQTKSQTSLTTTRRMSSGLSLDKGKPGASNKA